MISVCCLFWPTVDAEVYDVIMKQTWTVLSWIIILLPNYGCFITDFEFALIFFNSLYTLTFFFLFSKRNTVNCVQKDVVIT